MKVEISGKAAFRFEVTRELFEALYESSKRHYDYECKRATAVAGRPLEPGLTVPQPTNGLLTIWRLFSFDDPNTKVAVVYVDWGQLDLLCKIAEWPAREHAAIVLPFHRIAHHMFNEAARLQRVWEKEFEI